MSFLQNKNLTGRTLHLSRLACNFFKTLAAEESRYAIKKPTDGPDNFREEPKEENNEDDQYAADHERSEYSKKYPAKGDDIFG